MKTLVAALAFATALTAGPMLASADGFYFTEAFGGAKVENELGNYVDGGFTVKLAVGRRVGRWTLEGFVQIYDFQGASYDSDYVTGVSLGVDARYLFPMSEHLNLYVRGGLSSMDLEPSYYSESRLDDYGGRAIDYGAGIQLHGKVRALGFLFWPLFFTDLGPKVSASLFLDTANKYTRLHSDRGPSLDGELSTVMVGFHIGGDF